MNKGIWVIAVIAAFSAGTIVGTMTPSIPVADAAQGDNPQGVTNKLESVARILENTNARLSAINTSFVNPPDPDKPPIQAALVSIITEANNVLITVTEIQSKLGPP